MENSLQSSAATPNAKGTSAGAGSPENKDVPVPYLSSSAEVAAIVAASNKDDISKGKSVAADDDKELKQHIVAERNRRSRMKDYFGELHALVPQIPEKTDKATIVGYAINFIRSLEKTKATLEKRKQEKELARQVAADAIASSSSAPPPPLTAQHMALAAMALDVPDGACSVAPPLQPTMPVPAPQLLPATMSSDVRQPLKQQLAAAEPAAPPQLPIITARLVGFQTWSWPNLVLSVSNDTAYINVCAPRQHGRWTRAMVLSMLNKYGIEVVMGQVDSDTVRTVFNICARVAAMGGENPSAALEVYQLAVSEILMWLTTS